MINSIAEKKHELLKLPDGYLVTRNGCYYHRINGKDTGITKDTVLIRKLARKQYLQHEIRILENNEKLLQACRDDYKAVSVNDIIGEMSKAYKTLPREYFFTPKESQVFQSENPYKRENLIYRTTGGVYMRTKSELIIGNFLESQGIRYWYESKFILGGRWIYPDFLIEKYSDHTVIPMEHLGMLGELDYDQRNKQKIKEYIENDYFPGHNLICTYEKDIMQPGRLETVLHLFDVM